MDNIDFASLHDTDPARKWHNLANVLRVLGPEMDRRGWKPSMRYDDSTAIMRDGVLLSHRENVMPHLALIEAFHAAHAAQGGEG